MDTYAPLPSAPPAEQSTPYEKVLVNESSKSEEAGAQSETKDIDEEPIIEFKKTGWFSTCSNEGTITFVNKNVKFVGKIKNNHPYLGTWYDLNDKPLYENSRYEYKKYPLCRFYFKNLLTLRYEGNAPYGNAEGKGKYYFESGKLKYEGEFKNGILEGKCKKYYWSGELQYEGDFVNDKFEGKGKCYYTFGQLLYEGDFAKGKFQGKGGKYYKSGKLQYEGDFVNDKFEGKGKYYYESGKLQYEGDFVNDKFEGKGKYYYESKVLKYEGDFVNNNFKGKGKKYYKSGELMYEGEFNYNIFQKKGKKYYKSGELMYEGDFADNCYEGKGKYYNLEKILIGQFQQNILTDKMGTIVYPDGTFYQGNVKLYSEDGFGVLYTKNSKLVKMGYWSKGNLHKSLTIEELKNCDITKKFYEGDRNDVYQYNGKGTLYRVDKKPIKHGIWENGLLKKGEIYEHFGDLYCKYTVENFAPNNYSINKPYYNSTNDIIRFGRYNDGEFHGIVINKFGDKIISVTLNGIQLTDETMLECVKKEDFSKFKF